MFYYYSFKNWFVRLTDLTRHVNSSQFFEAKLKLSTADAHQLFSNHSSKSHGWFPHVLSTCGKFSCGKFPHPWFPQAWAPATIITDIFIYQSFLDSDWNDQTKYTFYKFYTWYKFFYWYIINIIYWHFLGNVLRKHSLVKSVKLLPPKSAKTFDESLQILSPRLQTLAVITPEFREKVRI